MSKKADYAKYLQSAHWQERRQQAIVDSENKCEDCELPRWLSSFVYGQDLHVHHLSYAHLGHEADEDLQVLCARCHELKTFGRSDLREPKTASCVTCHKDHWDVYSDHCAVCKSITGEDEPFMFRLTDKTYGDGEYVWRSVVRDLAYTVYDGHIDAGELLAVFGCTLERLREREEPIEDKDVAY